MRRVLWVVGVVVILTILGILGLFFGDGNPHNRRPHYNYFAVLGLQGIRRYSTVKEVFGEPVNIIPGESDSGFFIAQYDGLELVFFGDFLSAVRIFSPEFRFGSQKIGVGSTREEIENFYSSNRSFVRLSGFELAFRDGFTWLEFYFDENEFVNRIVMYNHGP